MTKMRPALHYFATFLSPYWRGFSLVILLTVVSTWTQVVSPKYLGQAVTALTTYIDPKNTATMAPFYHALRLLFIFLILNVLAMFSSWMLSARLNADSTNDMREHLFGKLQRITIRYFDTHQDGQLMALFTSDLDNIFNAMNNAVFELISQTILFIGTIWVMFSLNPTLALVTMASTPVIVVMSLIIMKKARYYLETQQSAIGSLNGYLNEQINGQKVIITNGLQQESLAGFKRHNDEVRQAMFKGQFYSGLLFPLLQGLSLLNIAIVIAAGSALVVTGKVSGATGLGLIVTFVAFSQTYFQPLTQLTSLYGMIQLALTGGERLAKVETQVEEDPVDHGHELTTIEKQVVLDNVHFGYEPSKEILHGVSICVPKGKTIALVGPTGSGKTTVMNLLNRFYDVTSGDVTFDGVSTKALTLKSLRAHVGIVLQEAVLFSGSIEDNLKYGQPEATHEAVVQAAKQVSIHDFIMRLPQQYQTQVSDESGLFSTGQKQLVAMARTLLTNPAFLILDEATSNVDTVTEALIQKAMKAVLLGRTSFVIAHRLKTILNADQIVVLKEGRVIEQGTHQQLLEKDGFYATLYHSQMALKVSK